METYNTLRHFADSWALLIMVGFFVGAIVFVFRPGSKAQYDHAARIPLMGNEDKHDV